MNIKLTAKKQTFCEEYLVDLNGTQAAIRAGYSKKTATVQAAQLLTKLNIQNEIQRLIKIRSESTAITAEKVLKQMQRLADMCMDGVPVTVKIAGETIETGEFKIDSFGANTALSNIAKHLGMYEGKGEQKPNENHFHQTIIGDISGVSDEDLRNKISDKSRQVSSRLS